MAITTFATPVNNSSTTIGATYLHGSGTMTLATGGGAFFPALTGSNYYRVTVIKSASATTQALSDTSKYTIYKAVLAASPADTLTIQGVLDGTTDRDYAVGDVVQARVSSGTLIDVHTAVNNLESGSNLLGDGSGLTVTIPASTTPTARSLATREAEVYNVKDWGVKGDGTTDDSPAIQALIDFIARRGTVSTNLRTIYFPVGSYELGSTLLFAQRRDGTSSQGAIMIGLNVIGDGFGTRFRPKAGFSGQELMRFEDCAITRIESFSIDINNHSLTQTVGPGAGLGTGSGYTAFGSVALHITCVVSSEHITVRDVDIDCRSNNYPYPVPAPSGYTFPPYTSNDSQTVTNYCNVGVGISLDYPNDASEWRFYNVNSKGASIAAFKAGNGVVSNVLDMSFFHCTAEHSPVGFWADAFPLVWNNGTALSNKIVDFFVTGSGPGGPIWINNVRSEHSNRFYWAPGGSGSSPTTVSNNFITQFQGFNHTQTGSGNTDYYSGNPWQVDGNGNPNCFGILSASAGGWDGFVFKHLVSGTLNFSNNSIGQPPTGRQVQTTFAGGNLALYVNAQNNMMFGQTPAASEIANKYFPRTNVFYNVIGQGAINGPPIRGSFGNMLSDHTSIMGGRVGIGTYVSDETILPTYGLYQTGGGHRLAAVPSPAAPVVTQVGTPGSTSYTYFVVAVDSAGNRSLPSPGTTTSLSSASLDSNNYNVVTWLLVEGAVDYDVLRSKDGTLKSAYACNGGVNSFVSSGVRDFNIFLRALSPPITTAFNDQSNIVAEYLQPARNGTADSLVDGTLRAKGGVATAFGSGPPTSLAPEATTYVDRDANVLYVRIAGEWVSVALSAKVVPLMQWAPTYVQPHRRPPMQHLMHYTKSMSTSF